MSVIPKPRYGSGLVVVAPEHGIPAILPLHPLLPLHEQLFKPEQVRLHQFPLIPVPVIHLQVMEVKAHGQLAVLRPAVADTVIQGGGGHFSHGHHVLYARIPHQLPEILMYPWPVGIKAAPIPFVIIHKYFRFGYQVHHVEPESLHALCLPEPDDLLKLPPHPGIIPV